VKGCWGEGYLSFVFPANHFPQAVKVIGGRTKCADIATQEGFEGEISANQEIRFGANGRDSWAFRNKH
jgi:hypothetical protein